MYSPKEESARQTRKNWLAKRQAHLKQEDPRMPVLEVQGILDPIAGDMRNLWPASEWNNPLVVSVPASAPVEMGVGETITFFLDKTELYRRPIEALEDLQFSIAPGLFGIGKPYELVYEHSDWLGNTMRPYRLCLMWIIRHPIETRQANRLCSRMRWEAMV